MATELVLVRHAHAEWSPDEQRPLSPSGRASAERLAKALLARRPAYVFSSPYARAQETVKPLARRLGVRIRIDDDLRERKLATGPVEDFESAVEATWSNFDFAHPGGESNREAQERMVAAVGRIHEACPGQSVVIATHGNALALFLNALDSDVGFAFWRGLRMPDSFVVSGPFARQPSYDRLDF